MILVTVGTTDFDDLVRAVDKIAPELSEDVCMQIGKGRYLPKNTEWFRFDNNMVKQYESASLIIAHGGAATTFEILHLGKKLISVDNKDIKDMHQMDILRRLSKDRYLIWCKKTSDIRDAIDKSGSYGFQPYKIPTNGIAHKISRYFLENEA